MRAGFTLSGGTMGARIGLAQQYTNCFALVCAGLLAVGAAAAQPINNDTTVADVISACDSKDRTTRREKCDRVFAGTLLVAFQTGFGSGDSRLCGFHPNPSDELKGLADFEEKMLAWMRAHPEMQQKRFLEGSFDAFLGAYACQPEK